MVISLHRIVRNLLLARVLLPTTSFTPGVTRNCRFPVSKQRPRQENSQVLQISLETSILTDLSTGYASLLRSHYYATQSATGGICSFMGDAIAQIAERNDKEGSYDSKRGAIYFCKGLGGGIMWTVWFDIVDPLANQLTHTLLLGQSSLPSTEQVTKTVASILLEQFLMCPLIFTFWDIPLPVLLLGSPAYQIPAQIREKLSPLLVANAKVWTPVNFITYNLPAEYRVLFASTADIFWQAINAAITSREIQLTDVSPLRMATTQLQSEPARRNITLAESAVK